MQIVRKASVAFTCALAGIVGAGTAVIGVQGTPWGAWIGLIPATIILFVGLRGPLRRWRVAKEGLPDQQQAWLRQHIPFYRRLDDAGQRRFERDVQFALDEWTFEGVDGADVTDALRLSVAGGVAMLLHGRPDWELPGTRTALFYPDRFDDNYYGGDYADYDGMAHQQGPILLSAPAVEEGFAVAGDGNNVVLHELAHLFDFSNDGPDGVPTLVDPASADRWQELVRQEMRKVRQRRSLLRPYAAEAPSEFFAVAVEVFFEQPGAMLAQHPALYEALCGFFSLDPNDVLGNEMQGAAGSCTG